jgi:hypothetical protein
MNETAQQYTERILSYVEGKQPLAVQAATAEKLERLIQGVPPSKLRERPAADKWSVSEIVAHLGDAEIVAGFRMRLILGAPGAPIAAYNQDSWVISGHYEKLDPRKSVEQFRVLREVNLALLESLTPEQWKHYGMHSERGQETIELMVRMASQHPQGHVPAGQALVYIFEVEKTDAVAFKIGAVKIRIGLDGQWVGANHGNTYF